VLYLFVALSLGYVVLVLCVLAMRGVLLAGCFLVWVGCVFVLVLGTFAGFAVGVVCIGGW